MADLSGGRVDQLLDQLEAAGKKVRELKDKRVKLPSAEINLLTILEKLRDLMNTSISGSKEVLADIFGGDCHRVARLMAVLDALELSPMNASDQRLEGCKRACDSMENVLGDLGSRDALLKAAEEEREALRKKYEDRDRKRTDTADTTPPDTKPTAVEPDSKKVGDDTEDTKPGEVAIKVTRDSIEDKWGFGLVVDEDGKPHLVVKTIDEGGVIDRYNRDNPGREIKIGFKIIGINGDSGDPKKMIGHLREALELRLIVINVPGTGKDEDAPGGRRAAASSDNPLSDAADPDKAPPEGAIIDPEWAELVGVVLCKLGCGRRAMPGVTKKGNPFDTCCRGCALGEAHDARCGEVDAKKMRAGWCKFGCGRLVAKGSDASGQALDTCCRGCALGGEHDEYCQKAVDRKHEATVIAIDEREIFVDAKKKLPPVPFNRFMQEIRNLNRGNQTVDDTIAKTKEIFGDKLGSLHGQVASLLKRENARKQKAAEKKAGYVS